MHGGARTVDLLQRETPPALARGRRKATRTSVLRARVDVLETHDVVLAEVLPVLDLDEDEVDVTGVGDPVGNPDWDVDG